MPRCSIQITVATILDKGKMCEKIVVIDPIKCHVMIFVVIFNGPTLWFYLHSTSQLFWSCVYMLVNLSFIYQLTDKSRAAAYFSYFWHIPDIFLSPPQPIVFPTHRIYLGKPPRNINSKPSIFGDQIKYFLYSGANKYLVNHQLCKFSYLKRLERPVIVNMGKPQPRETECGKKKQKITLFDF